MNDSEQIARLLFTIVLNSYVQIFTHLGFISPLCLPVGQYSAADQTIVGTSGIIAGWGASTAGE